MKIASLEGLRLIYASPRFLSKIVKIYDLLVTLPSLPDYPIKEEKTSMKLTLQQERNYVDYCSLMSDVFIQFTMWIQYLAYILLIYFSLSDEYK